MDDVRGDFLGPPLGTTPAAVITNKMKLRFFKRSIVILGPGVYARMLNLIVSVPGPPILTWS